MQLIFQMGGFHGFLTRQHLIGITADGVDLTVVYDKAVRMCSLPARVRVGTETGVYHGDGRFIVFVLQIAKEGTQLSYQEHTFVYDGTAGHGYYVRIFITLFKDTAGDVQFPVKFQSFFHTGRFFDERLHDVRHTDSRFMTENIRINRDFTVTEKFQTFFFHDDLEHLLCLVTFQFILWEEDLGDTILSLLSDRDPQFVTFFFEEFVGDLQQDTYTVSGLSLCIFSCAMLQIFYDFQSIFYCGVAFDAFAVDDCSDTTVIMLKLLSI